MSSREDCDNFRFSKVKVKNPYWQWFNTEGRRLFRKKVGRDYDESLINDKDTITKMWQNVSTEQKEKLKKNMSSDNRIFSVGGRRRNCTEVFRQNNISKQQSKDKPKEPASRTISSPQYQFSFTRRNTLYRKHLSDLLTEYRKNIDALYRIHTEMGDNDAVLDEKFAFVGISTGFTYTDMKQQMVYPIPMEISISTFTFRNGINDRKTILLDFDPKIILQERNIEFAKANIVTCAEYYNLPPPQFFEGRISLIAAWNSLKQVLPENKSKSRILCEKSIFNQVKYSLRLLAASCGNKELEFYTKDIDFRIIPIEDFSLGLNDAAGNLVPDYNVHQYFKQMCIPIEAVSYCNHHETLNPGNKKRILCQQARGAMAIHKFFKFLRTERLFQMDEMFQKNLHDYCFDINPSLSNSHIFPIPKQDEFIDYNSDKSVYCPLQPSVNEIENQTTSLMLQAYKQRALRSKVNPRNVSDPLLAHLYDDDSDNETGTVNAEKIIKTSNEFISNSDYIPEFCWIPVSNDKIMEMDGWMPSTGKIFDPFEDKFLFIKL